MKSRILVVLFIGLCLLPLEAKAEYDLGNYFPLEQANTWVYETVYSGEDAGTFEEKVWIDGVRAINGRDAVKMLRKLERDSFIRNSDYEYLAMDSEGVKLYLYQDRKVEPFALIFPIQLEAGATIESSYIIAADDDEENPSELKRMAKKITLEGLEDIVLKAVEFKDCLKFSIEIVQVLDSGRKSIENSQIWLAPNIGLVKETRLTKFIEPDGASREKLVEKEFKGALVRGVKTGEEVKTEEEAETAEEGKIGE